MQKTNASHTIYTHAYANTHIYMCIYIYMYVCIWKKMHTACNVGFLCVLGRWFSVKCRALYKLLGFFLIKLKQTVVSVHLRGQGTTVLEKYCSSLPSVSQVRRQRRKRDGGRPLPFPGDCQISGDTFLLVWPRTRVSQCCQDCLQWVHFPVDKRSEFFSPTWVSLNADEHCKKEDSTCWTHRISGCTN